jgi:hypothetical protein
MSFGQRFVSQLPLDPHTNSAGKGWARESKAYSVALLLVLLIILAPIWLVDYPGMVDYPNHLTRCYIVAHYHDNPIWQQRFIVVHDPIPNLAIDLIVTPLIYLLPLLVCGKIFLSLAAALYVIGCSEVGRAITGKPNWLALVCALTFYNSALLYGFVNYVFGLGIFLCAFAFWLRIRNAMTPLRFFLCCLFSIAAFLAHLSSFAILGVACCTIALLDFIRSRSVAELLKKTVWLACPLLLMACWLAASALHMGGSPKSQKQIGVIEWETFGGKLTNLLAPVRSYNIAVDLVVIALLLVSALILRKGCKIHSVAIVGLILFGLFLVTPSSVYAVYSADARYVVPGFLLLTLSIEPCQGRRLKIAMVVALVAMTLHIVSIAADWRTIDRRSRQVLAMGEVLPAGARVYVFEPSSNFSAKRDRGFKHTIQYWALSHNADISTFFTVSGAQPLLRRQPICDNAEWKKCIASYDYLWTSDPPPPLREALTAVATPAATWEKITLWRINPSPATRQQVP